MNWSSFFLILLSIMSVFRCEVCLDNKGNAVSWWVMINTPKAILQAEYIYFDSSFTSSNFQMYTDQPGASNTALGRTMSQINSLNLQSIAWNDEKPDGSTSSSAAHSKTVIAQNPSSNSGFVIDHSLPSYPSFAKNLVNFTIGDSQRVYGQHVFCMSLTTTQI